jgi:NAD(P)-dependent dehydrogenase (short-subunit alcohol dehydrogenase family)
VRSDKDVEHLASISQNIQPVILDVTKPKRITDSVAQINLVVGDDGLQGLVNNAGIAVAGPLEFLAIEDLRNQFDVNLFGLFELTKACLPLLRKGHGRVVNISSIGGRATAPFNVPYSASKHALEAFTDGLRRELMPWRIHVASVQPGSIATPIWNQSLKRADDRRANFPRDAEELYGKAMDRARQRAVDSGASGISPNAVAHVIFHALSAPRPRTRYAVGRGTRLAIWLIRFFPDEWVDWAVARSLYHE